jgi:hypothetical protein
MSLLHVSMYYTLHGMTKNYVKDRHCQLPAPRFPLSVISCMVVVDGCIYFDNLLLSELLNVDCPVSDIVFFFVHRLYPLSVVRYQSVSEDCFVSPVILVIVGHLCAGCGCCCHASVVGHRPLTVDVCCR